MWQGEKAEGTSGVEFLPGTARRIGGGSCPREGRKLLSLARSAHSALLAMFQAREVLKYSKRKKGGGLGGLERRQAAAASSSAEVVPQNGQTQKIRLSFRKILRPLFFDKDS